MDAFLVFMPSRTLVRNVISIKKNVLPEISSKVAGKAFLVKIKKKMWFESSGYVVNVNLLRGRKIFKAPK